MFLFIDICGIGWDAVVVVVIERDVHLDAAEVVVAYIELVAVAIVVVVDTPLNEVAVLVEEMLHAADDVMVVNASFVDAVAVFLVMWVVDVAVEGGAQQQVVALFVAKVVA